MQQYCSAKNPEKSIIKYHFPQKRLSNVVTNINQPIPEQLVCYNAQDRQYAVTITPVCYKAFTKWLKATVLLVH
jgi:hypothetical protein